MTPASIGSGRAIDSLDASICPLSGIAPIDAMRRLVEIDEVARAVAFLGSDDASAITGVDLPVDCGVLANLYISETLPRG